MTSERPKTGWASVFVIAATAVGPVPHIRELAHVLLLVTTSVQPGKRIEESPMAKERENTQATKSDQSLVNREREDVLPRRLPCPSQW